MKPVVSFDYFKGRNGAEQFALSKQSVGLVPVAVIRNVSQNRRYEFWQLDAFVQHYKRDLRPYDRFHQEIIYPDRPCRCYFDLESNMDSTCLITSEEWTVTLQLLDTLVKESFKQTVEKLVVPEPQYWHAHRKDKMSTHVIYDIPVSCPNDVRFIGEYCREQSKGKLECIDFKVYPSFEGGLKQLRLPYSSHFYAANQQELVHALLRDPKSPNEIVDVEALKKSFVGFYGSDIPDEIYQIADASLHSRIDRNPNVRSVFASLPEETLQHVDRQIQDFRKWLHVHKKAGNQAVPKTGNDTKTWRVDDIFCEVIGRRHKGNGAMATLTFNCKGEVISCTLKCLDCSMDWHPEVPGDLICLPEKNESMYVDAIEETMALLSLGKDSTPFLQEESVSSVSD